MSYFIHYNLIKGDDLTYDGTDIYETFDEYNNAREHKKSEGWELYTSFPAVHTSIMVMEMVR